MAKLPSYRRINIQDYPKENQELVDQLSVSINYGLEALYEALNGKLTFAENFGSPARDIDVTVDSTGKPTAKTVIKKTDSNRIAGLLVIRVQNLTNTTVYPVSGVTISYTETTESITVDNITGIQEDYLYRITVLPIR